MISKNSGTAKNKPEEHVGCGYKVGDMLRVKGTRHASKVAYAMACGEVGHGEVRYYLRNQGPRLFYYAEELTPVKGGGRGWGKKCPNPPKENG